MLSLVCSRCGSGGGDLFQRRLPDGTQDVCLCMACSNECGPPERAANSGLRCSACDRPKGCVMIGEQSVDLKFQCLSEFIDVTREIVVAARAVVRDTEASFLRMPDSLAALKEALRRLEEVAGRTDA